MHQPARTWASSVARTYSTTRPLLLFLLCRGDAARRHFSQARLAFKSGASVQAELRATGSRALLSLSFPSPPFLSAWFLGPIEMSLGHIVRTPHLLMVRTSRCDRGNPGTIPGVVILVPCPKKSGKCRLPVHPIHYRKTPTLFPAFCVRLSPNCRATIDYLSDMLSRPLFL